ncbi:gluconate 2-dehydrogenase subunit 3 family protein [Luteimonas viscosa]|uniref:Gluconate 2-dehydrogenase subunit 3 family protein n=1 Tax=Luteimonas viscosa TaxID=1132694 RepID=A0A5D4XG92_9GAMM|nr:gluconate 2-dehydrogenase subunit 3 family protein [Luteimonas viscosa]TYT23627.1 gluconate 2-dehydrogenase subunit 3 family protein [Luteimonas viscosa]
MRNPDDQGIAARTDSDAPAYANKLSRRDSLKLLAALAASAMLPALSACGSPSTGDAPDGLADAGHWPELDLQPVTASGYGKDPDLITPPEAPWPLTLTPDQLSLLALLSDIIVPAEGKSPSASAVQVPTVIDEWVSAPYPDQQQDRLTVLSALAWLDDEAALRFSQPFATLATAQQLAIIDDIAYRNDQTPRQFQRMAEAFARLRNLVLAAYFCTPDGMEDIGYMGNVAIAGDYPGPTPEAYRHLETVLADLGLSEFAYPVG